MKRGRNNLLCTILIVTYGCSSPDVTHVPDRSYFPLRVGNYRIYDVMETNISQAHCDDDSNQSTKRYELKEITYDSSISSDESYTYYIHRYIRDDDTKPWTDLDTWSARINARQVVVTEANTPYVKMIFPLSANASWNGNQYNNLKDSSDADYGVYRIKYLGKPYQLSNGKTYPATLTVVEADDRDFVVTLDKQIEVYASSVGVIYRETTHKTYLRGPCEGNGKVESGFVISQTLKSAGQE